MRNRFSRPLAAVVLAAGLALVAACGKNNPVDAVAESEAKAAAGDLNGATLVLKQAIQTQPDAWMLRRALAGVLMRGGAPATARIELEKALELGGPRAELIPQLAEAMVGAGAARALLDQHRATDLGQAKSNALLKSWLAEAHVALGELPQAARLVDEALALDPGVTRARLMRARLMAGSQDVDGALRLVDAVVRDDSKQFDAKHLKAELLWAGKGDAAAAEALLKEILATRSDHLPTYATLLSVLAQQGRFDDYARVLEGLKARYAGTPAYLFFDTRLSLARRDLPKATVSAQELVRLVPDHALSLQLAGVVDFENGSLRLAEARLAKAIQLDSGLVIARQMLGRIHLSRGQPRHAIDAVRPLLEGAAPDPRALAIAGEASMQLGNLDQAAEWFSKASKLAPGDVLPKTGLAVVSIGRGQRDAGLGQLQALAESDKAAFADLALLNIRLRRGEVDEAFKITDRLATKLPGNPLAPLLKGRILLALGDAAGARKSFEEARRLRQNDFGAMAALVDLDLAENAVSAARQRVEAMLKSDGGNFRVHMLAAGVLQRAGEKGETVMGHLREAIRLGAGDPSPQVIAVEYLLSQRKSEAAKSLAQEASAAFPDEPLVMRALGGALVQAGDLQQALLVLTRAAKLRPDDPQVQIALADIHLSRKNEGAALSSLLAAVELSPESALLRARLIALSQRLSRVADAQRTAKLMQQRQPAMAAGWVLESELAEARRDYAAAIAAALVALKKQDGASNAARVYALHLASGRRQEADRFAQSWLQARPRDALFLRYMGEQALKEQDYALAERYFNQLVVANPSDALALNNLAWARLKTGKPGAVALAEQAVKLIPGNPALLDTQAEALTAAGRASEALEIRRRVVALDPGNPVGRLKLAKSLLAQDLKTEARTELQALLATKGEFQGRAESEALLQSLR